jgi:phospholipid/cholesterol/gamma-HCH transport system substrate-binding protein
LEPKTNYTLVGLFVLILTAGLVITSLWLSFGLDKKSYNYFTVYTKESVAGLSTESLVKYNGVKVGYVDGISLSKNNPQKVQLMLKIENGTPITQGTVASLVTQGITGMTYLGLSAKTPSLVPLKASPGEPYPVIPVKPSFFAAMENNIQDATESIKRVFDEENAKNVKKHWLT